MDEPCFHDPRNSESWIVLGGLRNENEGEGKSSTIYKPDSREVNRHENNLGWYGSRQRGFRDIKSLHSVATLAPPRYHRTGKGSDYRDAREMKVTSE